MIKEGIYDNINIKDYHNDRDYFSSSGLKLAKKSIKLFKMFVDGEVDSMGKLSNERKMHFDFGNAFELALLDHESFDNSVLLFDEEERPEPSKTFGSILNKEWKEQLLDTDKYIINKKGEKESFEVIEKMLASCYQDKVIQALIKDIEYQYSIFWTDERSGLKLKTRPDVCQKRKKIIVDVKTTEDGSPENFSRDLGKYGYHFQACMQIDGVIQSGFMDTVDAYYWLVVEKTPPYSATLYEFDPEDIQWATDEYEYILGIVSQAFRNNKFPSYSQRSDNKYGILKAEIPLWCRTL